LANRKEKPMGFRNALSHLGFAACLISVPLTAQQDPTALQQGRHVVLPSRPSWENLGTDAAASTPATPEEQKFRQARSNAFNNGLGLAPRLEDAQTRGVGEAVDRAYIPPLPTDASVIVVARVLSAQSLLSSDHTAIYTELKLEPEKILKDNTTSLASSASFVVLERGGSVNLNGRVLRYPIAKNSDLVDIGKRYLLFLYAKPSPQAAFGVTKAWLLTNNHPEPTRAYRADDSENISRYMNMSETEFTSYVQRAIETSSTR
jgi:hypothetical protein